jgi:light-regulated signal transduction histidine kinase (bacteriophytochrome)
VIDGFCSGLEEQWSDELDDDGQKWLLRVRRNCDQLGELVSDLSALSRATRRDIDRVEVDLSALANEVAEELRSSSPDKRTKVTVAPRLVTTGDRTLLREVVAALLRQAWRYTSSQPDAAIVFDCEERDGSTAFFVRDNGAAIELAKKGSILEISRQGNDGFDDRWAMLSIGKALRIVRRHGGRMWAEPGLERGGTIFFTLRRFD